MGQVYFLGTFDRRIPTRAQRRHADVIDIRRIVKRSINIPVKSLTKVILVDIIVADFRRSEKTIWEDYCRAYRKANYSWKENETVLFLNSSGKMGIWMMGESRLNNCVVLDTRKWRLMGPGETWFDTDNLQYYASQAGFQLVLPDDATVKEILKFMKHPDRPKKKKKRAA
jgi:hypothetical protein